MTFYAFEYRYNGVLTTKSVKELPSDEAAEKEARECMTKAAFSNLLPIFRHEVAAVCAVQVEWHPLKLNELQDWLCVVLRDLNCQRRDHPEDDLTPLLTEAFKLHTEILERSVA